MTARELVEIIEAELSKKKISKGEFYKACGISSGHMSNWRRGLNYPQTPTLIKMSEYLGIDLMGKKTPATEDGSGRYGLKKSDWWGIGNCFKHELNVMARPPEYLANVSGIPADRVSAFLSGEAEISKVEIEALAKAVGKPLKEIIHGYAMAFDREESSLDLSEFLQVFGSLRPENQQRLFRIAAKTMQSEQAATQLLELSEKAFDTLPESGQE